MNYTYTCVQTHDSAGIDIQTHDSAGIDIQTHDSAGIDVQTHDSAGMSIYRRLVQIIPFGIQYILCRIFLV